MQFLINLPEILSTSMLNMEGVQISIRITAGILILIVAWDIYEQLRHLLNKWSLKHQNQADKIDADICG